jgi:hypothetical protein
MPRSSRRAIRNREPATPHNSVMARGRRGRPGRASGSGSDSRYGEAERRWRSARQSSCFCAGKPPEAATVRWKHGDASAVDSSIRKRRRWPGSRRISSSTISAFLRSSDPAMPRSRRSKSIPTQEHPMAFQSRELYRSAANGDRWFPYPRLSIRSRLHRAGQTSRVEVGDFLAHGGQGPEHQALLRLIGTLVEESART